VCQLGKRTGAKVIALAGSDEKCAWLEGELEVDKALNYKSETFQEDLKNAVGYLDVFFDNVGGEILDLALKRLNKNARVVLCGSLTIWIYENLDQLTGLLQGLSLRIVTPSLSSLLSRYAHCRCRLVAAPWPRKLPEYHCATSQNPRLRRVRPSRVRIQELQGSLLTGSTTLRNTLKQSGTWLPPSEMAH
jgi:hypothetical protein